MTLQEISGVESGIVIYPESHECIVCNWSSLEGLPRLDPSGRAVMGLGEKLEVAEHKEVQGNDIIDLLADCEIIFGVLDSNDVMDGGIKYQIGKALVITPHGWN